MAGGLVGDGDSGGEGVGYTARVVERLLVLFAQRHGDSGGPSP